LKLSLYLDTNVLISLYEGADEKHDALWQLVNISVGRDDISFHTSALSFSELLAQPYRERNRGLARQYLTLAKSDGWLSVHDVGPKTIELAAVIRAALRMKLPDAIHFATASVTDCSHIITSDTGFLGHSGLVHPISGKPIAVAVSIVQPNTASIVELTKALS
jgi:predicted nucleic acid-binding protein